MATMLGYYKKISANRHAMVRFYRGAPVERFPLFLLLVLGIAIGCSEKDDTGSSSGTTDIPADADADADGYDATDDCDDGDATVHPGADEVAYDGVDNDCDPSTADDDLDGDGFLSSVDCDDDDPDLHPGVDELCNDVDDDCDGSVDEDPVDGETFYADDDADGYGDPHDGQEACERPDGWLADSNDCDDADATVHPDAEEVCDGVDNDCNGVVDDGDGDTWYADTDGDGYGDITAALLACTQPSGHVADDTDCDDGDGAVHPGAEEVCNGVDDDCDGEADGSAATDVSAWYADTDGDGYGDPAVSQDACDQPTGYVDDDTDCDDTDARAFPGGTELPYDGVDGDCDGTSDYDRDADGFDAESFGGTDCDDSDEGVNPSAEDIEDDGIDQDCDGEDAISPTDTGEGGGSKKSCSSVGSAAGTGTGVFWMIGLLALSRRHGRGRDDSGAAIPPGAC